MEGELTAMETVMQNVTTLLGGASSIIEFVLTTFPLNLGVASMVVGIIVGVVRKGKKVTK